MRLSRRTRLAGVAFVVVGSLTLAACGGGSDDGGGSDKVISVNSTEPQNPLVPTATNEVGGGNVIDLIFAGLVSYETDGSSVNDVAESIETKDKGLNWTIKIKDDQKFSDGTAVTSKSFVDAWNYGADEANAQLAAYFYNPIAGSTPDGTVENKGKALSGLKVVDDSTFTVELKQPESDFPGRLGYSAYYPMPEAAFKDIKAYGENPIGNGPYKLAKKGAWEHDVKISLLPSDGYDGPRKAQNGGVSFVFYTNPDTAYTDVQAGNLDIIDAVPPSALLSYKDDSAVQAFSEAGSPNATITIPARLAGFGQNEEGNLRRQAISKAINRQEITEKIFDGSRTPATDFSSPLMPGFSDSIEGADVLKFDATAAKDLWAQADAIAPFKGPFVLSYNADGPGNKEWVEALTNQLKNNLDIDAKPGPYATFDELRTDVTERTIKTAFRTGWQPDYPSIFNYLAPIFGTGAGSNDGDYSNKEFDDLMKQISGATDDEKRYKLQSDAQAILFKDLPAIPLWNTGIAAAAGPDVKDVVFNWQNRPDLHLANK